MLSTYLIKIIREDPYCDRLISLSFKSDKELKDYVEYISKYPEVKRVEVSPFERKDMSYNEYIKKEFKKYAKS